MNKQTLFVSLTTAVMLCACQSSKVKISGRFVGNDAKDVYLEQVLPLTQSVIDSAVLDKDGNYRFELKGVTKTPSLYNVIYNGERIPLFLAAGEKLSLNSVGSVVRNYTVEGSKSRNCCGSSTRLSFRARSGWITSRRSLPRQRCPRKTARRW